MSSRPLTRVYDRGPHSTILLPSFTVQSPGYQLVTNCLPMQGTKEMRVWSLGWEDPLKEGTPPTPIFLPGESYGLRSLAGYNPWGHKELDTTQ